MPTTLNRAAYQQLIDEDREWLALQPRSLERDHIDMLLVFLRDNRPYMIGKSTKKEVVEGMQDFLKRMEKTWRASED